VVSSERPTPAPDSASPSVSPTPSARPEPARFEASRVQRDIRALAGDIGPREATSDAYDEAADLVEERFSDLGYRTRTERVRVPAGDSWGVPVEAGFSRNVIAAPPGFDPDDEHLVIGAHLDTVAVAPGAEDNASGVAMILELARLAAANGTDVPVQFVAYGAEEPRGPADDQHHFGSRALVADLDRAEREAIVAMVSLDRIGVGSGTVPVCASPLGGARLRAELRRVGRAVDVATEDCETTSSDHWSYAKAGIPAVRIGGVPYAGYHSSEDTPEVINPNQLRRVSRVVRAWLERPGER
jgi:Iap family predicted aminopeptidase